MQKAYSIKCSDIVNAIQLLQNGTIDISTLVEWVNVVWFTELFVFDDNETDSIVSVLGILENEQYLHSCFYSQRSVYGTPPCN